MVKHDHEGETADACGLYILSVLDSYRQGAAAAGSRWCRSQKISLGGGLPMLNENSWWADRVAASSNEEEVEVIDSNEL